MNHIKRLQAEAKHARVLKAELQARINDFRGHLALPKFQPEGNRWISTCDVLNWLLYIEAGFEQALMELEKELD
jgi:hypothetical protein